MARESVCKKEPQTDKGQVTFMFANGGIHEVKVSDFNPEIQKALILHGISQKLGDSYSGAGGDPKTAEEMFKAALEQISGEGGKWIARVAGAGTPRTTLLAEALARLTGETIEKAREIVDSLDDDQKKAVRARADVKAEMDKIKAERSVAKADKSEQGDLKSVLGL